MITIGSRIRQRRLELGMTLEELAKRTGYKSRSAIKNIEDNKRDISQSKIALFATALATTPTVLLGFEDEPSCIDNALIATYGENITGEDIDKIKSYIDFVLKKK